jgi:hypothetical protein
LCDGKQIRFVRLEETQQSGEERRLGGPGPQLVRPDSGQVEEPLSPSLITERCRKRAKGNREGIIVV